MRVLPLLFCPDFCSRLMQELHFEEWEFSIYFVGYVDPADIPSDPKERTRWCFQQVRLLDSPSRLGGRGT